MSSIHPNDPNTYNLAILIRTHISKKSRRSIHYPFLKIYLQIQLKYIRLGSMNIQAFNTTVLKGLRGQPKSMGFFCSALPVKPRATGKRLIEYHHDLIDR
jgi:hypothetical protein